MADAGGARMIVWETAWESPGDVLSTESVRRDYRKVAKVCGLVNPCECYGRMVYRMYPSRGP